MSLITDGLYIRVVFRAGLTVLVKHCYFVKIGHPRIKIALTLTLCCLNLKVPLYLIGNRTPIARFFFLSVYHSQCDMYICQRMSASFCPKTYSFLVWVYLGNALPFVCGLW